MRYTSTFLRAMAIALAFGLASCDTSGPLAERDTGSKSEALSKADKVALCHYSKDVDKFFYINVDAESVEQHIAQHGDKYFSETPEGDEMYCEPECFDVDLPVLEFVSSNEKTVNGNTFDEYWLRITNSAEYPAEMFASTSDYGPCGLNLSPSRTWLNIHNAGDDAYIYGYCALSDVGLNFWFALDQGTDPPPVYVDLWERGCDVHYKSNTVQPIAPPYPAP